MKLENIDIVKQKLKRLEEIQIAINSINQISNQWKSMKIVVLDDKHIEFNISAKTNHSSAILISMMEVLINARQELEDEILTL